MHIKFTHVFVLARNFGILILWIQEEIVQSQPLKSAVLISLNPAVTWSDHYTFKNAWLVSSSLWSLARPGKRTHSLTNLLSAVTYLRLKKYSDWIQLLHYLLYVITSKVFAHVWFGVLDAVTLYCTWSDNRYLQGKLVL